MSGIGIFAANACKDATGVACDTGLPHASASSANINSLLSVAFGILGALAVLIIVIGAFNFVNSEGDPQKASNARSTMIYALVGLVVAIMAEAIVGLVLGRF